MWLLARIPDVVRMYVKKDEQMSGRTILVLCLIPAAVAPHVRLLLLLLAAAAEHLVEETELRGSGQGPETEQEEKFEHVYVRDCLRGKFKSLEKQGKVTTWWCCFVELGAVAH